MPKYRKKPVIIEARQWTGSAASTVHLLDWVGEDATVRGSKLIIKTLEGDVEATPDDYIIKGVAGEFYPCKAHIFDATYEVA